ncbi:hypothetical protein [Actinosynnema mirum]|uniref:hypothetical protein n=1 Tax=Actinosynnema mirum TaxID=40567 RepID=UPI00019AB6FB|nr:hypothetical protein [Actinosynnema mirum]
MHADRFDDRRARARTAAKRRGLWAPERQLALTAPVRVGRVVLAIGQLLLPLDLPAHRRAAPAEQPALAAAA